MVFSGKSTEYQYWYTDLQVVIVDNNTMFAKITVVMIKYTTECPTFKGKV